MERGGWVMLPLLLLSVIATAIVIERVIWFRRMQSNTQERGHRILVQALRDGSRTSAVKASRDLATPSGRVATHLIECGVDDAAALDAIENVRPGIERFLPILSTIITAAPLLGILGTVVGIIDAFRVLGAAGGNSGAVDLNAMGGAIASALITTAAGLVIALVTLFPFVWIRGRANRMLGQLEVVVAASQTGFSPAPAPTAELTKGSP